MDAFNALENRVGRLIEAYRQLKERVAALEQENERLRQASGSAQVAQLQQRVAALEGERSEVRTRLERLLGVIEDLGV